MLKGYELGFCFFSDFLFKNVKNRRFDLINKTLHMLLKFLKRTKRQVMGVFLFDF